MKLDLDGVTITAHFNHFPPLTRNDRGTTLCRLHFGECLLQVQTERGGLDGKNRDGLPVTCMTLSPLHGLAKSKPGVQYNYATGRKVALARAMGSLDRAQRTTLWASYFAICPYQRDARRTNIRLLIDFVRLVEGNTNADTFSLIDTDTLSTMASLVLGKLSPRGF